MTTVTRYTIQCFDPDEPDSWFLMPTMYRDREEAEKAKATLDRTCNMWGGIRHSECTIIEFKIEVPVYEPNV